MTEVLYDLINNEIYLFEGNFEIDKDSKKITIVLLKDKRLRKRLNVKLDQIIHIGWL